MSLCVQPDGKILVGGFFTRLGGGGTGTTPRNTIGRLNPDGSVDTAFDPGATTVVYALAVQPDGKILVGGEFTTLGGGGTGTKPRSRIARLHADGSVEDTFNPVANASVSTLAVQPDGKILVGGLFSTLGGATRNRIGRLHPDGALDTAFNPGANFAVHAFAVQPDGKIVVGGDFLAMGGGGTGTAVRNRIARLHPDGSLDTTFNPGANGPVYGLALQPDGKILAVGVFTGIGGGTGTTARHRIARLHPDGTIDEAFNPGANNVVQSLALQPDGKILVGGFFTALGGGTGTTPRIRIGRLNADGTVDTTFDPQANADVLALAVQFDGKIVAGGLFTMLGGGTTGTVPRNFIGRLHPDGALDTDFNPGANNGVRTLAIDRTQSVLAGGYFTAFGGGTGTTTRNRIARVHYDGTLDTDFNPGASFDVSALAVQYDAKILVGGAFTTLGGGGSGMTARSRIGRLNSPEAAFQRFDVLCLPSCVPDPSGVLEARIVWGHGGPVPELTRVTFEVSSDGVTYGPVTSGTRVSGTWQAPQDLPGNTTTFVRARGYYPSGFDSGSVSIVESVRHVYLACPTLLTESLSGGTIGVPYTSTFTASGALGPVAFGVASTPPPGLGVTTGGVLNGTPTQAGTFSFTVFAIDLLGRCTDERTYELTISPGNPVPTLSSVSPQSAPSGAPPFTLVVNGSNFVVGAEVRFRPAFGGDRVLPTLFINSTRLEASVVSRDLGVPGAYTVTVVNPAPGGGTSNALPFTVLLPTMALDKTALRFGAVTSGQNFVSHTAAQLVRLTQTGVSLAGVGWTAVSNQPWLKISPASGNGSAVLSISVAPAAGLPASGVLTASIAFTFTGASNSPGPIVVTLSLIPDGTSSGPFGIVDTPTDNRTGVTGAIPFTGWALDDVEVAVVMICRAAFGAEVAPVDPNCAGAAQIFLGFAVFIDGARPDVQATFPNYAMNSRGGWGFMVLTNMLPNQGNGTYHFFMYARDREGKAALLGTRTMTCANAAATVPFGAIDTPAQGGVAGGNQFVNFGWALTPNPKFIPANGSTITVLIDGVGVGTVDYNHFRPDIAALFPGLANSSGAVGFRMLDTTAMTNGLHTIAWVVTDSAGATEGIGSRFFTVSNGTGGGGPAMTAASQAATRRGRESGDRGARAAAIAAAPLEDTPVPVQRGWNLEAGSPLHLADREGRIVVRSEEVDRVELLLGERAGEHYTGYVRVGDDLAPLPVGSTLDLASGTFAWAPGAGFVGAYDLVFVRWAGDRAVARREVRVILAPKH